MNSLVLRTNCYLFQNIVMHRLTHDLPYAKSQCLSEVLTFWNCDEHPSCLKLKYAGETVFPTESQGSTWCEVSPV